MTAWISILSERWPGVWDAVRKAPALIGVERVSRGAETTLIVQGIQLTSRYNRAAEARLQAETISPDSPEAWVYGIALGDLPRRLLERPELRKLNAVVMNPSLSDLCFRESNPADWLADPRVELHLGEGQTTIHRPFAVTPACLRLASEGATALRDSLVLELGKPHEERHWEQMAALRASHMAANEELCTGDGDVTSLFGTRRGDTVFVVGGGPTLTKRLDWIKSHRNNRTIVAVSTALVPLQRASIAPDVVVVVDANPSTLPHIAQADASAIGQTCLVYIPTVYPQTPRAWPGKRLAAYLDRPRFREMARRIPKGTIFCSGSVIHAAVDLAVQMGAAKAVLFGADFGYPEGKSHADGAVHYRAISTQGCLRYTVRSGTGELIGTDPNMIGYLRDLETYVAAHPEVEFVNGSRDGAMIYGTRALSEVQDA